MDRTHVPVPPARRREEFRRRSLPFVVWGAAVLAVGVLLVGRARQYEHLGIAEALRHEVSAPVGGTVAEVAVQPLQRVEAGAVVARLADPELEARLSTAQHALAQVRAQLDAARAGIGGGAADASALASDLRRFQSDEEQRRLTVLSLRAQADADRVELERLTLDAERARRLSAEGVMSAADHDNARLLRDQLAAKLAQTRALLAQAEQEERVAAARRRAFEQRHGSGEDLPRALEPLVEAVNVAEGRSSELRAQLAKLTLRAPVRGEVAQVLCRAGQAVVPGEAIAVIVPDTTETVVAWLSEAELKTVREGARVSLARRADPSRRAESVVARIGAAVEPKPPQLWRDPRVAEYGLPIAIPVGSALKLTPGEGVLVTLKR